MATQVGQAITVDFDVPARMRDGTLLRANIYRPAGEGRWPVLLTRLPYGKDLPLGSAIMEPAQVARRGYVVIVQDTRGRFTSEGEWAPFINEGLDGVDTIEWAAQLPYSDGNVGMYGISYFGFTQWASAVYNPPALKAMVPFQTWNDPFNGVYFRGGALELGAAGSWQLMMGLDVLMRRHRGDPQTLGRAISMLAEEMDALGTMGYWSLPLREFAPLKRHDVAPAFFENFNNPMDRSHRLIEPVTIVGKHEQVTVPSLNVGGWYDIFLKDTITNFTTMREHGATPEARQSKLLIGPWSHGGFINPIGELNFGFGSSAAFIDLQMDFVSLQVRWFDHWLKGIDTGMLKEAPIKLFVMGANVWRDEQEWPLARAVNTRYYLHSNGHANTLHGDGYLLTGAPESDETVSDHFDYDPGDPVITRGGALLMSPEYPIGAIRPARGRGPRRCAGLYLRRTQRGPGGHGPHFGASMGHFERARHRFRGAPGRCPPRRLRAEPDGRHHSRPLPQLRARRGSLAHRAGEALRVRYRPVGHQQRLQGRSSHPRGYHQQQFPALGSQSQHRPCLRSR